MIFEMTMMTLCIGDYLTDQVLARLYQTMSSGAIWMRYRTLKKLHPEWQNVMLG